MGYTEEELQRMYDFIYQHYMASTNEELIFLWQIHKENGSIKGSFDSVGKKVCEDILEQRENSYLYSRYFRE